MGISCKKPTKNCGTSPYVLTCEQGPTPGLSRAYNKYNLTVTVLYYSINCHVSWGKILNLCRPAHFLKTQLANSVHDVRFERCRKVEFYLTIMYFAILFILCQEVGLKQSTYYRPALILLVHVPGQDMQMLTSGSPGGILRACFSSRFLKNWMSRGSFQFLILCKCVHLNTHILRFCVQKNN